MLNYLATVDARFESVFQSVLDDMTKLTNGQIQELVHLAGERQTSQSVKLRLTAETVKATAEKIIEERG